jgi:hypothetical protein
VQLEEIDDPFPAIGKKVVETMRHDVHGRARRRHLVREHGGGQFHQRQGRGFQRLDEPGRQADGHAVAVPELAPVAGLEASLRGISSAGAAGARDVGLQLARRGLDRNVALENT